MTGRDAQGQDPDFHLKYGSYDVSESTTFLLLYSITTWKGCLGELKFVDIPFSGITVLQHLLQSAFTAVSILCLSGKCKSVIGPERVKWLLYSNLPAQLLEQGSINLSDTFIWISIQDVCNLHHSYVGGPYITSVSEMSVIWQSL